VEGGKAQNLNMRRHGSWLLIWGKGKATFWGGTDIERKSRILLRGRTLKKKKIGNEKGGGGAQPKKDWVLLRFKTSRRKKIVRHCRLGKWGWKIQ